MAVKKTTGATSPRNKASTEKQTTPRATPARKSAGKPAAAKKSSAKPARPAVVGVSFSEAAATLPPVELTKKELFQRVKARAEGVKGRDLRRVLDVVLSELGGAIAEADTLKIQPLGTVKVQKRKDQGGAEVMVVKLRRKKPAPEGKDPLAEPDE